MTHSVAKKPGILAAAFLAAFMLFAAAAPAGDAHFSGDIVVGATFPLTGAFEYYGQSAYYGAVARARAVNEAGGVNGKRLVIEWRDNQSDPALSASHMEEFARDLKVPAVIGPLLSDSAQAVRGIVEQYKVVAVSPMATADSLVRDSEWIFRATFNNTTQAEALINFQMRSYGAKTAAVLYDPRYGFSTELAEIFAKRFAARGGKILASLPFAGADGTKDFAAPLKQLAADAPDFIFAPLYALEAVEMMRTLKDLDIGIRVCGSDTWDNELVFDASGRRLINTAFASSLFEQSFNYRPFQTFFTAMEQAGMENPDAQAACAWDAVSMLAEAFKTGETAEEVRAGLRKIRRMALATGRLTILPSHESQKPVLIRVVERQGDRLIPVFADRHEP